MANFALADPSSYIAHFYSAALMAGATRGVFRLGWWSSELTFHGVDFRPEDLAEPFTHLMTSPRTEREWALQELAIALQAATGAGVRKVELSYPGLSSKELKGSIFLSGGNEAAVFEITLRHRRPLWAIVLMTFGKYILPEYRRMRSGLVGPSSGDFKIKWAGWSLEIPAFEKVESDLLGAGPLRTVTVDDGKVAIGVDGALGERKKSVLFLCVRGRIIPEPLPIGKAQVTAILEADHLRLDLSQSGPVESAGYLRLRQRVASAVMSLQKVVLLQNDELSDKEKRGLVREIARSLRTEAKLEECIELLRGRRYDDIRLASLYTVIGDLKSAEESLKKEVGREGLPQGLVPSRLFNLAAIQARTGDCACFDTWSEAYKLVVEQHQSRKGHLVGESIQRKLLWLLELREPGPDEEAMWHEARELMRELGAQHRRQAKTLEVGALLYLLLGKPSKAKELALESVEIRSMSEGGGNPTLGQPLTLLALSQSILGEEASQKTAKRRLSMMTTVYGEDHPEVAASHYLSAVLTDQNEKRQASLKLASEILNNRGLPVPLPGRALICYRGWFSGRSPWDCAHPLMWPLNPQAPQ